MSVACSKKHAPSVGQYSSHTPPGSAISSHRSHQSRVYESHEFEESPAQARSVAQSAARSAAPIHSDVGRRLQEDIPAPPKSVVSFAGPEVDPSDSVSQIGSRAGRSRVSQLRVPQAGSGTHRSKSASALSEASSARLTEANLHAHDASPQPPRSSVQEAENRSQAKSGHTARQSQREQSAFVDETYGSQKAQSATPSRASTAKPLQRDSGNASQAASRASQKQATHVSAYRYEEQSRSHASYREGSRANQAARSHVSSRHQNEEEEESESEEEEEGSSQHGSQHQSQHGSQHYSQHGSQHYSQHESEHGSQHGSQHQSQHGSEHYSQHESEHYSQHGSEHHSQHGSQHGSKAGSAAPSHSGSKTQHNDQGYENVEVREQTELQVELRTPKSERRVFRDGYSPSSLRKAVTYAPEGRLALVHHRPTKAKGFVREPVYQERSVRDLSFRERGFREPVYRDYDYRRPVYRERTYREPALRSYDSDPESFERRYDTQTVEVEVEDEQAKEPGYKIKRRHEYRVDDERR